jgi:hypothetical protein
MQWESKSSAPSNLTSCFSAGGDWLMGANGCSFRHLDCSHVSMAANASFSGIINILTVEI